MNDENPYAAPQADLDEVEYKPAPSGSIVRDGNTLLLWEGDIPPGRCVACNRPASEKFPVKAFRKGTGRKQWIVGLLIVIVCGGLGGYLAAMLIGNGQSLGTLVPIALFALVFLASRFFFQHNLVTFDFVACRFHKALWRFYRWGIWAICILYLLSRPIAEQWGLWEFGEQLLPLLFLMYWPLFILMWKSGLMVRPNRNQYEPYVFKGFGKRFLSSIPDSEETTSTQTPSP